MDVSKSEFQCVRELFVIVKAITERFFGFPNIQNLPFVSPGQHRTYRAYHTLSQNVDTARVWQVIAPVLVHRELAPKPLMTVHCLNLLMVRRAARSGTAVVPIWLALTGMEAALPVSGLCLEPPRIVSEALLPFAPTLGVSKRAGDLSLVLFRLASFGWLIRQRSGTLLSCPDPSIALADMRGPSSGRSSARIPRLRAS